MTSSTTPSARWPSAGPLFDSRSSRGWPSTSARSASRTTTGWAQLPPTQPSIVPSGWTIPRAPGLADVGRWTATTVATAKRLPSASTAAIRGRRDAEARATRLKRRDPRRQAPVRHRLDDALLVEDPPHLLRGDRDVDVRDAEVRQRVDDGVRDRWRRA